MSYDPNNLEQRKRNRQYQRDWYQKNKKKQKARVKIQKAKRTREIQIFLCEYLSTNPCGECGQKDIRCLDFHHIRGEKSFGLFDAPHKQIAQQRILDEINKCEVLCRNCHHIFHIEENDWYKNKYLDGRL